jgi:hypothetical protein
MTSDQGKNASPSTATPMGPAGWIAVIVLTGFLGWAIWYAIHAWSRLAGVGISPLGWVFLVLGIVVTVVVGSGLMALLFYSSRKGKDF